MARKSPALAVEQKTEECHYCADSGHSSQIDPHFGVKFPNPAVGKHPVDKVIVKPKEAFLRHPEYRAEESKGFADQLDAVHQRFVYTLDQRVNHGGKTIDHAVNRNHTQPISGAHHRKTATPKKNRN